MNQSDQNRDYGPWLLILTAYCLAGALCVPLYKFTDISAIAAIVVWWVGGAAATFLLANFGAFKKDI